MTSAVEFEAILAAPEGRNLEFKEANNRFSFEELIKYCVALANEGGGTIVLGVTDARPRIVVGTIAFKEPGGTEAALFERLHHPVPIEEMHYKGKRVLLIHVPARLTGTAWQYNGTYFMRAGDALLPMSDDRLRRIHLEAGPDFTAEICSEATTDDLDPVAIELLRQLWQRKSPGQDVASRAVEHLLADAELVVSGRVTFAALVLLGKREALGRFLGQAEVIFEYRSNEIPGPAAERREYRAGFLTVLDEIWQAVSRRNDLQHFQYGFFVWDVPTFNERAVREAVLNAVSHRDYRLGGSVFVRQYPRRIEIVSPGGFPAGINPENILWEQNPRNRRVAEVLARCGLVERAGQGLDLIFRECIRQGKRLPDFSHTGEHSVWVTMDGEVRDPEFLRFLESVGKERQATFTTEDFLVIDLVHREQRIPDHLAVRLKVLRDEGIIELVGRGRGARYLLSRRFYRFLGQGGAYTRKKGLDHETNKALLLRHIVSVGAGGAAMAELQQVLPGLGRKQIQKLLGELRDEDQIKMHGTRRWARWCSVDGQEP